MIVDIKAGYYQSYAKSINDTHLLWGDDYGSKVPIPRVINDRFYRKTGMRTHIFKILLSMWFYCQIDHLDVVHSTSNCEFYFVSYCLCVMKIQSNLPYILYFIDRTTVIGQMFLVSRPKNNHSRKTDIMCLLGTF